MKQTKSFQESNRLYYWDDYIGSITSEFVLLRGRRLRRPAFISRRRMITNLWSFGWPFCCVTRRGATAQLLRARGRTRGFREKAVRVSAPNGSYAIFHDSTAAARLCERGRGIALLS